MAAAAARITSVTIDVLGTPAPKGSSRPMLNRKTGKAFTFAGGSKAAEVKLGSWDSAVRAAAAAVVESAVIAGAPAQILFVRVPVDVAIVFRIARPGGHWARRGGVKPSAPTAPHSKPDIDKLARSTLDSLTGIVFDDDSRIVRLTLNKVYAAPGREGASIVVDEWRPA